MHTFSTANTSETDKMEYTTINLSYLKQQEKIFKNKIKQNLIWFVPIK
jgi:ABC-type iron transport system FetAB ATPase subunit